MKRICQPRKRWLSRALPALSEPSVARFSFGKEAILVAYATLRNEQANRDRFVLPETKDVSFFVDTIDRCIEFLN